MQKQPKGPTGPDVEQEAEKELAAAGKFIEQCVAKVGDAIQNARRRAAEKVTLSM